MVVLPPALAGMASYRQFILVRFVSGRVPGKTDKLPIDPATGEVVNAHDAAIWMSWDEAAACALAYGPGYGLGFVFTVDDPFWFIDVDNCLSDGAEWLPIVHELSSRFSGAACEVSQSGRGVHFFGIGRAPEPRRCKAGTLFDLYTEGRFVAFGDLAGATGDVLTDHTAALAALVDAYLKPEAAGAGWTGDGPVAAWCGPADDNVLIARALAQAPSAAAAFGGGVSFRDLWEADPVALGLRWPDDHGGREYDASSADAALAQHLAYWTGSDGARMERLMRRSGLAREKWEHRPEYLERTITRACSLQTRWCSDLQERHKSAGATQICRSDTNLQEQGSGTAEPQAGFFSEVSLCGGKATLLSVENALRSAESNYRVAHDDFHGRSMIANGAHSWRPLTDVDLIHLRHEFEQRGFKAVPAEVMRDAVTHAAHRSAIDTAVQWAESLRWDGVPRIDTFFSRYLGAADTPYTRAVGAYLFTALAGRCVTPGVQVDMVPILVDRREGTGKTSAVRALAPDPDAFLSVTLDRLEHDDTARNLKGKLVVEMGELRGLMSKDQELIKDWVTRTREQWVEKYQSLPTTYYRRWVAIGTSNRDDLFNAAAESRRWLPVRTGEIDLPTLQSDRDQLWAEGLVRYRAAGVAWADAMRLAPTEREEFSAERSDTWLDALRDWLDACPPPAPGEGPTTTPRGQVPFTLQMVLAGALGVPSERQDRRAQHRAAGLLRALGYEKRHDRAGSRWVRTH